MTITMDKVGDVVVILVQFSDGSGYWTVEDYDCTMG